MFAVLDTNHYVELIDGSALAENLQRHAIATAADLFTSVITMQEITQGWLAEINRRRAGPDQLNAYRQFHHNVVAFSKITVLPFDEDAVRAFAELQSRRIRIGTMDLKIAAICIAHDALLLTRNRIDFEKVPGLRFENWLDLIR